MLTFKEKLYQYISKYLNETTQSPSFAELTKAMGISPKSKSLITKTLKQLKKEGKLLLVKDGRRLHISLCEEHILLLGNISAGNPIETIAEYECLEMNHLFQGTNRFALQVKGTSMVDEGKFDGDLIICRKSDSAREGDIVVALIDNHNATLKRISYQINNMITLIPANTVLKPRAYCKNRIQIQGIYIGLVRIKESNRLYKSSSS